jgi:hypothetical protein
MFYYLTKDPMLACLLAQVEKSYGFESLGPHSKILTKFQFSCGSILIMPMLTNFS